MRPSRLRNNFIGYIAILSITAFIIHIGGCSSKTSERRSSETTQNKTTAKEKRDWTDTIIGSWYLRLHGPGPVGQHPVWEGPVEIGSKPGIFSCKMDLELIDSIWVGPQNNILIFDGYSGSKTYNYIVNVDSCSSITKQMPAAGSE
jgi:hypothetical protein